jgi:two-component system, NarL family, response regulator
VPIGQKSIRVLIVDDHPLLREGIAALIRAEPDMEVAAEAGTGREALAQFKLKHPDVTLMDLQMPDMPGIEAIIAIRGEFPDARIIVLTTYSGDVHVTRALKAGARGYLLKTNVNKELLATIRAVNAGQKRIPAEVSSGLAEHTGEEQLTDRELDVLRLIASGNANKEIAAQLQLAEDTVKRHVTNILSKLGANDRTHAVTIGLKRGIIEL